MRPLKGKVALVTGGGSGIGFAITKALLDEDALIQLPEPSASDATNQLASVFTEIFSDEARRREMGIRAREVCRQNSGATERTMGILRGILSQAAAVGPSLSLSALSVPAAK